jgi:hypothetical protein
VSAELAAITQRLLSLAPDERFQGESRDAAEALEQAARSAAAEADVPLFHSGHAHRPRWRSPGGVQRAAEQDAQAREQFVLSLGKEPLGAKALGEKTRSPRHVQIWGPEAAVAVMGLLFAGLTAAWLYRGTATVPASSGSASHQSERVAVGDSAEATAASTLAPVLTDETRRAVGLPMPEEPFPGQRTPPCDRNGEEVIRGGCWYMLGTARLPCRDDAYEWKGACYLPSYPPRRPTTSHPQ